mmetsp:Transcript_8313/g.10796  ORF Transcript_8313/g.10796 Transcript_8313/m.10796 type:complete len:122 (-) Transcript_8313:533-898(-)
MLTAHLTKVFSITGMTSATGKNKTFDESADGYVRSEGCGMMVLSHSHTSNSPSYATVCGAAIAHDGKSASLTAPNGRAQEQLIRSTLHDAGMVMDDVDYLELTAQARCWETRSKSEPSLLL